MLYGAAPIFASHVIGVPMVALRWGINAISNLGLLYNRIPKIEIKP